MLSGTLLGVGVLISGYAVLPNKMWGKALYMVAIGGILGLLMSGRQVTGENRVDIVLIDNGLRRVKAKDLMKTKMKIRDIVKYGDILGFDLVSGADEGHTYKWVDRYGGLLFYSNSRSSKQIMATLQGFG